MWTSIALGLILGFGSEPPEAWRLENRPGRKGGRREATGSHPGSGPGPDAAPSPAPLLLVHVMPWFEAPPQSKAYGFHWTMNKAEPPKSWASHFQPSLGLYDSLDRRVVEAQVALIKTAGFDGILADWYGPDDALDYGMIHRRTLLLFEVARKAGLKFGVVWEDQTIGQRIRLAGLPADQTKATAERAIRYVTETWAKDPLFLRLKGKPSLLVFGPQALKDNEWPTRLMAEADLQLLTLHHRRGPAVGAFDWPLPGVGVDPALDRMDHDAKAWPIWIATAFPRFQDWYQKAGIGPGYGEIKDDGGLTYRQTLERGIRSGAAAVQVATWNDWGEGTQIEPSKEFGLRDLIVTQELRRKWIDPGFKYKASDLEKILRNFDAQPAERR